MATIPERPHAAAGDRIRRARRRLGISQENFAPLVGVTRRHLIRLENGEHQVGHSLAVRIAEATGLDMSDLRPHEQEAALSGEPFRGNPRDGAAGDGAAGGPGSGNGPVTKEAA